MNTTYSESVQQQDEDYRLIQDATAELENILGKSADRATVEWSSERDDTGTALYSLRLKDPTVEVQGQFAPDELRSRHQMRFRLYRIWGDLLQQSSLLRIAKLQEQGN